MAIPRALAALPLLLAAAPVPPLMPGQWEETLVFALDQVNGSGALAEQMAGVLPSPRPRRGCLTAADLADPQHVLMGAADGQCRFTRFAMTGGALSAAGDCRDAGRAMHVEGKGRYTATGYDFDFTGTGEANRVTVAFRGRDSGRRLGTCPAA